MRLGARSVGAGDTERKDDGHLVPKQQEGTAAPEPSPGDWRTVPAQERAGGASKAGQEAGRGERGRGQESRTRAWPRWAPGTGARL